MIEGLIGGFGNLFQPFHFFILMVGVLLGFIGGGIPGISGTMLVIILLPVSYAMDPAAAFLLLTSIYATSVFSGSISAILFRTPGTPEAVATVFDGYPMAKKGEGGKALGISIFSSATGGVFGTLVLIFLTPLLASFALRFSSPEYFALALMGLTVVASLSAGNLVKGFIGVSFGLFIATIGIDTMTGVPRFTFGSGQLMSGIDFIPVLIGLFAISEVLRRVQQVHKVNTKQKVRSELPDWNVMKRISGVIGRSSLLGVFIGILPGIGATTAAMLSYSEAARWSKRSKEFGTGIPEGVAAPESANNAAAMGAMVPLLSLGIPGSATTAILLGAFILHGIQPGPLMFTTQGSLIYTILMGLLVANLMILLIAKPFISVFSKILQVPYTIIGPLIVLFCIVGTFAVRNSIFDVAMMLVFGIIGYYLENAKFPLAPIVLGVVLGPIAEDQFRRAMQMSNNDISIFFTRPIALTFIVLSIISILYPFINKWIKKRKNNTSGTDQTVAS
ncbi:tripartite tricarboxylate transporter permease [Bacillus sp. 7894-2]|uniref:tripartite tricarboxylate transporter permease n=1 Tax=Bacillus sp. 7894-2 TaxID=2021695 RepID=UPI000BA6132E|nr:tripartite tricarboxylate transporter permease [Bacillus sp. 7894-2]PAE26219.1 C4-dicarboxylate ABC transporter permease [Bacillus sp. 7894-2]